MLTIVTFLWKPPEGYRSQFRAEHVRILRNMVARHYRRPHRFVAITDSTDIDPDIEVLPLWSDHSALPSPHGKHQPSCYRRLKLFSRDAAQWLGERIVSLDLDCVITGDLTHLWDRSDDFVIWGDTNPTNPYNGSMILMNAGARPHVWETFDPVESPKKTKAMGFFGSDQAWLAACLGKGEKRWTTADGVYSYRVHLVQCKRDLPQNARVVMFHGQTDPWSEEAQKHEWVRKHYR